MPGPAKAANVRTPSRTTNSNVVPPGELARPARTKSPPKPTTRLASEAIAIPMSHLRDRIWNFPAKGPFFTTRRRLRRSGGRCGDAPARLPSRSMVLGLDVDFLDVPTTPLQLLVTVLLVSVVAGIGLVALTTLGTPLVDRRWPA